MAGRACSADRGSSIILATTVQVNTISFGSEAADLEHLPLAPLGLCCRRSGRGCGSASTRAGGDGSTRSIGRSNVTKFDVGEGHRRVGAVGLDIGGSTGGGCAGSTRDTWLRGIGVGGEGCRVKPEHIDCVVVPDRENEYHSLLHTLADARESPLALEACGVLEGRFLVGAELRGDRIVRGHSRDVDL